jgi:peptidyl-prolyl cis-trans isomerase D
MIALIRKFLSSKVVLALFALILLAFLITGFGSGGSGGLGNLALGGGEVAKIGSVSISSTEAANRIKSEFENARQEKPGLLLSDFIKQGGAEATIDRLINSRTILAFGEKHGMVISERLIDSEVAKNPAFNGPTGKFDHNALLRVLSDRNLTEIDYRTDVKASLLADQVIPTASGAARAPKKIAAPYASLLLEKRFGLSTFIPASRFMGAVPSDAEVKTYYDRSLARYTVPETRVVKYALFDRSRFEGKIAPTEAEIAAAYKADAAKYGASEKRILSQVIVQDQKAAAALTAQIRSGTPMAKAASAAGFEASTLAPQDKKAFAGLASAAAADAAFALPQGGVIDPAKSGLGWHVVQIDKIITSSGTSLADARSAILPGLTARKIDEAMADMVVRLEDAIDDGATFDDVAKKEGLTIVTTPAVTASGIAPSTPGFKAGDELTPILKDAYQSEAEDDPSVVTVTANNTDALVKLERIIPAAPKALADIKAQVTADAQSDRAARAARKAATDLVAKVNSGTAFAPALSAANLPIPQSVAAQRLDIAKAGDKAPAGLVALFKLAKGKARMIEAQDRSGYLVLWLERLEPGNAAERPDLVAATEGELSRAFGNEYTVQLLEAMKADLGVTRDQAVINQIKASLLGGPSRQ